MVRQLRSLLMICGVFALGWLPVIRHGKESLDLALVVAVEVAAPLGPRTVYQLKQIAIWTV